ncbi:triphosphoribosyl-dephospho-CoA synthase [Jiella avicenniae]|uniref:Triphosphoribosyl-dephospho-CoA synthase n=1 Tax=Jiella avicenniae TaxID=2907202 RepID=A0A9X1P1P7_9HYPH|nr:triphosphoribosyl-dephospho-CoA synthase [Jiella avicenniae]MCE7028159.1 triphosphoribosyl-dephospho-CoA synthase [Jiella avicenniae]
MNRRRRRPDPAAIEAAFRDACRTEVETLKPGNVHRFAPGHGMTIDTFLDAAAAAAPMIARPGASVGERISAATKASFETVGVNANLGIVLLCAPLAAAAETIGVPAEPARRSEVVVALRSAVASVLAHLDAEDARLAFAAIALANPGGLGARSDADVRSPPKIGLVEAMALAADVDLVARQFRDGFREIFEVGLPAGDSAGYGEECNLGDPAALAVYLAFASRFADSHIARKYGLETAEACRKRFETFSNALNGIADPEKRLAAALAFDAALKRDGRNPGTSADLTVATLFVRNLAEAPAG